MLDFRPVRAQRGAAALLVLAALTAAASLLLIPAAGERQAGENTTATHKALAEAHAALLGYAAAYPDRVNARFGPGYLPCPARDARGFASPACARASGTTLGRFPWHTLRANDLRDASGAGLWYALAQSHRNNPKREPLNATTVPDLDFEGESVAAVVIAPGAARAGQVRGRTRAMDATAFLEGRNSLMPPREFAREAAGNDRIIAITHAELRQVIEARAASELRTTLQRFSASHGGRYPWLIASHVDAVSPSPSVGQSRGWLAIHASRDEPPARFRTAVRPAWNLVDADIETDGDAAMLSSDCLTRLPCRTVTGATLSFIGAGDCAWWAPRDDARQPRRFARCTVTASVDEASWRYTYAVDASFVDTDGDIEIRHPDDKRFRTRSIEADVRRDVARTPHAWLRIAMQVVGPDGHAHALVNVGAGARGQVRFADLRYALDVEAGELPAWLVNNAWHRELTLVHAPCGAGESCLGLSTGRHHGDGSSLQRARALLIAAGPPLGEQPGGQTYRFENRFEGAVLHALEDPDASFVTAPPNAAGNDRIYIVEVAP